MQDLNHPYLIHQSKRTAFFLALLIYLSTIAGLNPQIFFAIIVIIGYSQLYTRSLKNGLTKNDYHILFFVLFSIPIFYIGKLIDKTIGAEHIDWERSHEYFPFTIFLLGTVFFSQRKSRWILRYLLAFILVESVIVILEFFMGVPYLIEPSFVGETQFGQVDLLYFNRVYGLSPNVSMVAQKIMIGIVIVFVDKEIPYRKYLIPFLLAVLVLSFGRTAIVSVLVFLLIYYLLRVNNWRDKALLSLAFLGVLYMIVINWDEVIYQLSRGKSGLEVTSGRNEITAIYWEYFENNVVLGNFFEKIFIFVHGRSYHSHNSYLQMLCTMGALPFLLFLWYLKKIINRKILLYLLPFLIFSLSQYGLFWGCSMMDIVFYMLIFNTSEYVIKKSVV